MIQELQGYLLVASPHLGDSSFAKTVVLLLHHDEQGAFGVVLNRPVNQTIQALWAKVGEQPCASQQRLNLGGPLSGPVMALHSSKSLGELEVPPGVYLAAGKDHLERLVQQTDHPFRVFIGHAGWGRGQLEQELRHGLWLTAPAAPEHIFSEDDHLWDTLVKQIGRAQLHGLVKLKHIPEDPCWN